VADGKLIAGTAADGFPVAECELAPDETGLLPSLIEQAADSGARRLWVHSAADLTQDGLTAVEGYRRLAIGSCPAGAPPPPCRPRPDPAWSSSACPTAGSGLGSAPSSPGTAEVETWGEPAAPYLALGFTVAEETPGWELVLNE
jgi:hypothetical protein